MTARDISYVTWISIVVIMIAVTCGDSAAVWCSVLGFFLNVVADVWGTQQKNSGKLS